MTDIESAKNWLRLTCRLAKLKSFTIDPQQRLDLGDRPGARITVLYDADDDSLHLCANGTPIVDERCDQFAARVTLNFFNGAPT